MKFNKKAKYVVVPLLMTGSLASAQNAAIKGEVKNSKGQYVPMAFIHDASNTAAAFADSSGNFLIKAPANGALTISALGYGDTNVALDGKTTVNATLSEGAGASSSIAALPSQINNNPDAGIMFLTRQDMNSQNSGTRAIKEGFNQEPTKGSPYLFQGWAHAYAIGTDNKLLYDISSLYNYDKLTGQVVFTKDKASLMQVNKADVKQIFVYDGKLFPHIFESNPAFPDAVFVELMVNSAKGKLYKQTTTKLVRANFHTDGVIESGHKYDEYVDAVKYYFIKAGEAKPKSISLKKNALKEAFVGDADKFIDSQGGRDIDDNYLRELNASLN